MANLKKIILFLLLALFLAACRSSIRYDNTVDAFVYKPDSEYDYYDDLGTVDRPVK
jgi:hypothetical protein